MSTHEKYTGEDRSKDSEEDDDKKEKKSIEQFNPPNPKASGLRRKKGLPRSQGDKKIQELKGFVEIPDSNETLYKEVQSILNKLTPQTFQTLLYKMKALPIDTERKLRGVVDLVFDKAVSEAKSSEVYANMCRCLSMFKVPSESKSDKMVNFRAALLTKSQIEFEMDKSPKAWLITKRKETEKNGDRAENKELEEDLMNEFCRMKQRYLGHMRFMGELFKLKMITENIMHDCVFKLLRNKDPEKLECLCVLLTTIGKELDVEKAKPRMDQYFQQMGKIVRQEETPSGLRIIMQDVMDLRTNGWVPLGNSLHTVSQMQKETTQTQEAQNTASPSQQRGGCRVNVPSLMSGVEGRNTQNVDEVAIQLGPGGRAGIFSVWGRGSTSGTADKNSEKKKKNSFRAACGQSVGGSHREKYGEHSELEPQASTSFQLAFTKHKVLSENEMEKKTKAILDEYFAVQDTEEVILCVQELPIQKHHHFVYNAIKHVLERSSQAREQTGHILHDLVRQSVVSFDSYLKGLTEALKFAEDFEIDIPYIWQYYGELISPMVQYNSVIISFLEQVVVPLIAKNKAGTLLAEILRAADHTQQNVDESAIQLGIGGGAGRFSGWGRGSTGRTTDRPSKEKEKPNTPAYSRPDEEQCRRFGGVSPARGEGRDRGFGRPPSLSARSFQESERERAVAAAKAIGASQSVCGGHRERSRERSEPEPQPSPIQPVSSEIKVLSEKDMEKKTKAILDVQEMKELKSTSGVDSAPTTPTTGLSMTEIELKLHELIVKNKADNETIFDWIESNVDDSTTKRAIFIRALTTVVCESAIKGKKGKERLEPKEIGARNDLLQKYLDHQADSELQALCAVQAFIAKLEHPQGVLRVMFDTLYDEDIISEDAFFQWERSEEEPEGKSLCLKQATQFFTWLREAEEGS